jgi:hypothetical protein
MSDMFSIDLNSPQKTWIEIKVCLTRQERAPLPPVPFGVWEPCVCVCTSFSPSHPQPLTPFTLNLTLLLTHSPSPLYSPLTLTPHPLILTFTLTPYPLPSLLPCVCVPCVCRACVPCGYHVYRVRTLYTVYRVYRVPCISCGTVYTVCNGVLVLSPSRRLSPRSILLADVLSDRPMGNYRYVCVCVCVCARVSLGRTYAGSTVLACCKVCGQSHRHFWRIQRLVWFVVVGCVCVCAVCL